MSPGEIAGLIAACAFFILVVLLAFPLFKLVRVLGEASRTIRAAREGTDPLFTGANTTLTHVNTQLERVDGITANARSMTGNVSALTSLFTATLGGPLVKGAAMSYGLSKAVRGRRKKADTKTGKHLRRKGAKRGRSS
jgi:hypothetical protein